MIQGAFWEAMISRPSISQVTGQGTLGVMASEFGRVVIIIMKQLVYHTSSFTPMKVFAIILLSKRVIPLSDFLFNITFDIDYYVKKDSLRL